MSVWNTLTLPPAMTRRDQWLCWATGRRNGKTTKIPKNPNTGGPGRADEPQTWASYEAAKEASDQHGWGLGFVFTDDDPLIGIDLDHMRDPETGEVDDRAEDIITELDSFTEISPSGEGFHIIARGDMPSGRKRHDDVEMYADGRFFTVTGNKVPGTPSEAKRRDGPLRVVHERYLARDDETTETPDRTPDIDLDENELLKKAKNASNGDQFEALWNGHTRGYDSHSEADLALCSYLAFWTGGDAQQMDELFRQSGLYRDKWDQQHSSSGQTYGEMTIEQAIRTSTSFYTGETE